MFLFCVFTFNGFCPRGFSHMVSERVKGVILGWSVLKVFINCHLPLRKLLTWQKVGNILKVLVNQRIYTSLLEIIGKLVLEIREWALWCRAMLWLLWMNFNCPCGRLGTEFLIGAGNKLPSRSVIWVKSFKQMKRF